MDYRQGFLKQFPKLPEEIKDSLLSLDEKQIAQKPFLRFKKNFLPFHFEMNIRGGWITPDANWYLPSQSSDTDLLIKRRLIDPRKYNYNTRLQAFTELFVRLDWKQPVFNGHFSTNPNHHKELSFSLDCHTLLNQRIFWAIQQIAIFYEIASVPPLSYKLNIISYQGDKVLYESKNYAGLAFFLLGLQTLKNKTKPL